MKKQTKIFLFSLTLLLFKLTGYSQGVKVKFYNRTQHIIDSLVVNSKFIGSIQPDSCSTYVDFATIEFDSGTPLVNASSIINNKKIKTRTGSICGTEISSSQSGLYEFDILFRDVPNKQNLIFASHQTNPKIRVGYDVIVK